MSSLTSHRDVVDVVIGVDTHVRTHSAAVVDAHTGAVLDQITVGATSAGYRQLVAFADQRSSIRAWAIEGTGSHGAGLARWLHEHQELVAELDRPVRPKRRNGSKSDPLDAVRAAREALTRPYLGAPRANGQRQALSVLLAARRSAIDASGVAQRQLFGLVIAAPEVLRTRFRDQSLIRMVATASRLRLHQSWDTETRTTATTLRTLGNRARALALEAADHEKAITAIVRTWHPELLDQPGIGPITAAVVLCAWSHPGRIRSEAAFAMLAGVAPIPANSGQTTNRYRLNRHGDRQLNWALHTIACSRLRYDERTKAYAAKRTSEGKTNREIRRCLKRYIARELFRRLENAD